MTARSREIYEECDRAALTSASHPRVERSVASLWKAPLAGKYNLSRSILIRPERLIVTACHVNCDHHSEPWAFCVCLVGGKTPTPVWVRSLKPERNLPLLATETCIDQPQRRRWQLIREGTGFDGYGNWSGFRTVQRWSPVWDAVNCNHSTQRRQLKPIKAGYYESQW